MTTRPSSASAASASASASRGPGAGPSETLTNIGLVVVLALFLLAAVLDLAGSLAIHLAGHDVARGDLLAGLVALRHVGDPALAWHGPVGSVGLYWSVTAGVMLVVVGLVAGVLVVIRRAHRDGEDRSTFSVARAGCATRDEVRRAAGPDALLARAGALRPSVLRPGLGDCGVALGSSRGISCWSSVEDSVVILGPPRSGKGLCLVVGMILDAPGAVLTTSTRPDNLAVTINARSSSSRPVAVFDPQGLARGIGSPSNWSLVRGCAEPGVAMVRARALCADASSGTENASFWAEQTVSATRCLLHAAALGGRDARDLYRWSLSASMAREAVAILLRHRGCASGWAEALDAIVSADQRQRDSVWAMVANTFAALADPDVLAAVSPGPGTELVPEELLRRRGTLYLLGTSTGAVGTSGLVSALVEDVVECARRLAAGSPRARLDPPLGLVLDEAANYALPPLASLVADGGGSGITTTVVLQSLAGARHRFGRDAAQAIWDASITKVVLGGGANADDLVDLSRLLGERDVTERSESVHAGDARRSFSYATRQRPVLLPDELRRLPFGTALLLQRSAPPILLTLRPWTTRRDAAELLDGRQAVEQAIESASSDHNAARRRARDEGGTEMRSS